LKINLENTLSNQSTFIKSLILLNMMGKTIMTEGKTTITTCIFG